MAKLPSGLSEDIDDSEDLARFIYSSSQYSSTTVKPSLFLPSPKDRETSVLRHGLKPRRELWKIGEQNRGERNLHGVAILKAEQVRAFSLTVIADEPPPRHAAIRNWPADIDPILEKAKQKELALRLSQAAGLPILKK